MEFMESSSPSSRPEAFPVGLRVLVVDDDPTWLKILEKMLRKCSYEVTTCGLARVALDLLRERKYKFDIVISDVNMPDMDGFKLLEHVGLEMDLPVIMMSVDGETSRVMKGVQHGACDYLLKPIRMKELRNIWQHVYRKKIHEVKEIENHDIYEEIQFMRNGTVDFDDKQLSCGSDMSSLRKRKDLDNKDFDDQDSAVKKARVVWSVDLHQKFVTAVNQIGFEKVGPKKILDLMNIPGLTRENVASHLQKYRLYLSRLQKQPGGRTSGGNTLPDVSFKNPPVNYTHQNSILPEQNTAASRFSSTTQKIQAQGYIPSNADDITSTVSLQAKDRKEAVKIDALDSQKVSSVSELGVVLSFKGMPPNPEHKAFEDPASKEQSRSGGIPFMQFMQYPKHDHEPYGLLADYSLPSVDHLHTPPSVSSKKHSAENQKAGISITKPVFVDNGSRQTKIVPPSASTIDSVSVQVNHGVINTRELGASQEISASPSINNYCFDQISNHNHESMPEPSSKVVSELDLFPEDLRFCSPQGIDFLENIRLNSLEFFDSALVTDTHCDWYDGLELNSEYMYGSVLDECLFA